MVDVAAPITRSSGCAHVRHCLYNGRAVFEVGFCGRREVQDEAKVNNYEQRVTMILGGSEVELLSGKLLDKPLISLGES